MKGAFLHTLTVPFYDVDALRIVWHGNYAKYFEEARCAFFARLGMSYTELEEQGLLLPVIGMEIKYIRPCRFGETLSISVEVLSAENFLELAYTIRKAGDRAICTRGRTRHAAVEKATGALLFELPAEFVRRLNA